jgi:low affinity Fe/Cu permease
MEDRRRFATIRSAKHCVRVASAAIHEQEMYMRNRFGRFASAAERLAGTFWAFLFAASIPVVWIIAGYLFGYSSSWELAINTSTGIITFLMVFLIQNSQDRQSRAIQLKLNELLRSVEPASNHLINIEVADEEDLERLKHAFRHRAERVRNNGPKEPEAVSGRGASLTGKRG